MAEDNRIEEMKQKLKKQFDIVAGPHFHSEDEKLQIDNLNALSLAAEVFSQLEIIKLVKEGKVSVVALPAPGQK